jgi:hypothetical protein
MKRPTKHNNVLLEISTMLEEGKYMYIGHANQRLKERSVTRLEVKQALKNGYHEKRKDEFKEEHNRWNYSIRGKTIDSRNLRIAITFDKNNMLVITVIDLDK